MASAQVVETLVNTNNSPSQDYTTTNPDDHSNHNIDSPGFKPFTVIQSFHSKVLKMFLNIIVSIGSAVVIFNSHKPTGSTNQPEVQTNRKYKPTGSKNIL